MIIDVVLPCLNEAAALGWVLGRMPDGYRPLVADNGSTDGSADVAVACGARVVPVPVRGYGAAVHAGVRAARSEVVAIMDADASLDPAELPAVTGPVTGGAADLVLGRRVPRRGAWPWHARLGNRVLAASLRRRTGCALRDLGPMRALRRVDLVRLDLADRRFGYPLEMVVAASAARWRIREVEVAYLPRTGRSKVTGTALGTLRTIGDMRRVLAAARR